MTTQDSSSARSSGGAGNTRTSETGGSNQSNESVATAKKTSDYYPHGIRLSVWANQMNMQEDEAMPLILERTKKVVTEMLPE